VTKDADGEDAAGSADAAAVKAYETLRCHVLTGSTLDRPAGLVVLLRHGVAAWRIRRSTTSAVLCSAPAPTTRPVAGDRHEALVRVLVNMVLGTHQEVRV
jgi:hypothetical protein